MREKSRFLGFSCSSGNVRSDSLPGIGLEVNIAGANYVGYAYFTEMTHGHAFFDLGSPYDSYGRKGAQMARDGFYAPILRRPPNKVPKNSDALSKYDTKGLALGSMARSRGTPFRS